MANKKSKTQMSTGDSRDIFAQNIVDTIKAWREEKAAFRPMMEERRAEIAKGLKLIWAEFERIEKSKSGETINGAKSRTEWCKKAAGITMRYAQYLLRDGSRKRDTNPVRVVKLTEGMTVQIGDREFQLTEAMIAALVGLIEEPKEEEQPALTHAINPNHKGRTGRTYCNKISTNKNMDELLAHGKNDPSCPVCAEGHRTAIKDNADEMERRRQNAEAWVAKKLAEPLGECEGCCDGTPATERIRLGEYTVDNYCAKCAADTREYNRKQLIRQMGVPKVCGKLWSWKRLPDEPKMQDDGEGNTVEMWSKRGYLETLKEEFLGNPKYDQAVVEEYIASVEKKMEAVAAKKSAQKIKTLAKGTTLIKMENIFGDLADTDANGGAKVISEKFEAAVLEHPEWSTRAIDLWRRQLAVQIADNERAAFSKRRGKEQKLEEAHDRTLTPGVLYHDDSEKCEICLRRKESVKEAAENEMHPAAKALAAAVDGAVVTEICDQVCDQNEEK